MRAAPLVALAGLALVATPAAATPGTLSGRLTDGKPPPAAVGRAYVQAVSLLDGRVLDATTASPAGAWKLSVDPGWYVLTTQTVRIDKPSVWAIAPVQRVRSGRTTRTNISLRRTRTPRIKKKAKRDARRGARAATTPSPPVGVRAFSAPAAHADLGPGLAGALIGELTGAKSGDCEAQVIEVMHRADILAEHALANSKRVDPKSRIRTGHLIEPQFFIQGSVDHDGTTTSWNLELVDKTGQSVGGDSGSASGADIFDALPDIAQRLLDQLCGVEYQVLVNIQATIAIPPYSGFGTMTADVPVKDVSGVKPPTTWEGQANAVFAALSYGGVPGCDVIPGPHDGYVKVAIRKSNAPGMIEVTWGGETFDFTTLVCGPAPPIPNGVPPIMPLLGTQPGLLIFPASGGTQSVSGGVGTAGGAWSNSGTVTVIRVPKAP